MLQRQQVLPCFGFGFFCWLVGLGWVWVFLFPNWFFLSASLTSLLVFRLFEDSYSGPAKADHSSSWFTVGDEFENLYVLGWKPGMLLTTTKMAEHWLVCWLCSFYSTGRFLGE